MEKVVCDNCSDKFAASFLKDISAVDTAETFNLTKCSRCGLVYLNPRPPKKIIGKYYFSESYWDKKANPAKAYRFLLNILKHKVKKGRVLDIGAATGLFLSNFKKNKWEIEGTDISKTAARLAKDRFGIKVKIGDFLDIKYPTNHFDIVTFNNVLEHLYQPKETLVKVHRVLKKGGTLLITVPNLDSVGFKLFKKRWYGLDVPRHLYQFTPSTLEKMVTDCGFKNVKVRHGYFYHNFPVLFESFRRRFSPRIQMMGEVNYVSQARALKRNLIYQIFKETVVVLSKAAFIMVAIFEPVIKKGEVIVLEAVK